MQLSHSQLEAWQSCQFKWALDHVFKAPKAPGRAFIEGRALHKAIEIDGLRKLSGKEDFTRGELIQVALDELGKQCKRDDPDHRLTDDARALMQRRIETMVRVYYDDVRRIYTPIAAPEEQFDLDIGEGVRIRGVIDARNKNGFLDWKTASRPWADARDHIDQAICYMLVHPDVQTLTYVVFACDPEQPDTCVVNKFKVGVSDEQKRDYIARMQRTARAIRQAETDGMYVAQPTNLCAWCSYLGACTIGQNYLDAKHLPAKVPLVEHESKNACPCCGGAARVWMYGRVTELAKHGTQFLSECRDCFARYSATRWDSGEITIDFVKTPEQVRAEKEKDTQHA